MKRINSLFAFSMLACFVFLFSCKDDEKKGDILPDGQYPLVLTTAIDGQVSTNTKATVDNTWNGGELVQVSIDGAAAVPFTAAADGTLTPVSPVYWQASNQSISVRGWYPDNWTMQADQSTGAGYQAADFIFAPEIVIPYANRNTTPLTFFHKTAKVTVVLASELTGATVEFYGYTTGTADTGTGILSGSDNGWIAPLVGVGNSCKALLIPQNMAGEKFIKITHGGKDYFYIPSILEADLLAGKSYVYRIAISSASDDLTVKSNIIDWDEEVDINVLAYQQAIGTYVATNKDGGKLNMYQYTLPETGGDIYEMKPGMGRSDFNSIHNKLQPGDMVVFYAGEYDCVCAQTTKSGTAEKPIIFTAYGDGPVKLINTDVNRNLWEIRGSHIVINGFEFNTTTNNAIIRIMGSDPDKIAKNITVANCYFSGSGNTNINANGANMNINGIYLYNNYFTGVNFEPLYIGEHNGASVITNFVMDGNFVDGTNMVVESSYIGYGIQLKKNVVGGIIRNNYIVGMKGPGIMVYGADDQALENVNIVENNFVAGARTSSCIHVGAGPSIVRNNIAVAGLLNGISTQNYNYWGIMDNIQVIDNIAINNNSYGIDAYSTLATANGAVLTGNIAIKAEGQNGIRASSNPGYDGWESRNTVLDDVFGYNIFTQTLSSYVPSTTELNQIAPLLKGDLGLQDKAERIFTALGK